MKHEKNRIYNCPVYFTPKQNCEVNPPIVAGGRDMIWVKVRNSRNGALIRKAARQKCKLVME
jgi:hypothetical protein